MLEKLINPFIKDLPVYEPGKPVQELERESGISGAIKLASNENPLGPSPSVIKALTEAALGVHIYPVGDCFYLKRTLAEKLGICCGQLIFGNGSDEIIALVCQAFLSPGDEVIYAYPAFIEYELISRAFGAKCRRIPLRNFTHDLPAMAAAVHAETKLIFIANPNNPTGTTVDKNQFADFMRGLPGHVIAVVDEAYYEFVATDDFPDSIEYIRQGAQLIVMRTFSKAYALAGLRIGYGIADAQIIQYLNRVRHPFNVNSLAQSAAIAALQDEAHLIRTRRTIDQGRACLSQELERLGLEYVPSAVNFILLKVGQGQRIYQALLRKGVIVRAMDCYDLPEYIRVTVGTQGENTRFIEALREVL
ncbi:MAG: histidinol-phosphate transaminase [Candidatus Schekmanbacteria bacterium]|nr:histidinol-phosphate transaminase [Candidatus Schekmanbacteria bacterium]